MKVKTARATVTLRELNSARSSVNGRLARLRRASNYCYGGEGQSPIERIGVFEAEIDVMETTLRDMQNRLNNAKITIEL